MQLHYYSYHASGDKDFDTSLDSSQTLVIVFGSSDLSKITQALEDVTHAFSHSIIIGASTSGEILMDTLQEDSLVVAVVKFQTTQIRLATEEFHKTEDSFEIGKKLANRLQEESLKSVFVLSDGLNINGSDLTHGLNAGIHSDVIVSGGLAGDGATFSQTWVLVDGKPSSHYVTAVGLYGENIHVGYGSEGGWDIFGIQRVVTKSSHNVVYELDGQPILDIYKKYLGEKAKDLPASGLLFPLGVYDAQEEGKIVVRTILAIDEEEKSITFAGNIPMQSKVCLIKSNNDRLIDAAQNSSNALDLQNYTDEPLLSIAISCIGRKLVLKQRAEEELEATLENLPQNSVQVGFYSYGEISPTGLIGCELHNQTMTLTTLWESDA